MSNLEKELKKLSAELTRLQTQGKLKGFSLIGALAVSARARPRATRDIDFLVSANREFFFKILPDLLKHEDYRLEVFKGSFDDPVNGLIRIYDDQTGAEIADIIPVFWNWQDEIVTGAEKIELLGITLPVARIEDLIVLKLKAGGPQDIIDTEELLKVAKLAAKIDLARLTSLAKRAGVSKKLHTLSTKIGFPTN
jgi:predicted nucleotidyltransferase